MTPMLPGPGRPLLLATCACIFLARGRPGYGARGSALPLAPGSRKAA
jgi:hypothetical protein